MLKIEKKKCIGCGLCPAICSRAFRMNEVGDKAEVIDSSAAGEDVDESIGACPTEAISQS